MVSTYVNVFDEYNLQFCCFQKTNQIKTDYFNDILENNGTLVLTDEGEQFNVGDNSFTFKLTSDVTNGQLGVYEIVLGPRAIGANLHYHRFMDETFIVQKGVLTMQLGEGTFQVHPGAVAYAPRFTPHGFRNDTDQVVKIILIFNPSSKREGFFRGLQETLLEKPIDPEKYLKLYNKYDSFPVDVTNMIPIRVKE